MSPGTALFTANGFTSGSVNRPWHTSRPTAAARPWIMHGGKFKMTSGFEEASLKPRFFEKLRSRQRQGLLQELKYFRSASSSKHSCLKSSLCSLQHDFLLCVVSSLFLALFYFCSLFKLMHEDFNILKWLDNYVIIPQCWYILCFRFNYIYSHFLRNCKDPRTCSVLDILQPVFSLQLQICRIQMDQIGCVLLTVFQSLTVEVKLQTLHMHRVAFTFEIVIS